MVKGLAETKSSTIKGYKLSRQETFQKRKNYFLIVFSRKTSNQNAIFDSHHEREKSDHAKI